MTGANSNDVTRQSTSAHVGEKMAEDVVALLLKHKRGLYTIDDVENQDEEKRKPKRVLGPEKPSFLNDQTDDTWVPP
ncbi:kanadaptin [Arachis hypogaea]|nr:kanadaptin [Arachis hypogaea]